MSKETEIDELLDRGTIVEILPTKKEFRERLVKGEKLRFYIGFDATAPTLHLSHAKNFILMEKFRKLGHEVIILFGDFTARIGDPSDQTSARQPLTKDEVEENVKKWKKLISPLMDFQAKINPPKIMYNSAWLSKLSFEDLIALSSNFTVQQFLERDMFKKRLKDEKPIHLNEFLYPMMQGYDSVAMEVDAEVCGTDQIFNALTGRTLLKKLKNKEKFVVAVTLMENPKTGELMSKSKGTGVFLDTDGNGMFGQVMAQPDEMIEILLINCTLLTLDEIKQIMKADNPRDAKFRLASEVTKIFFGEREAEKAGQEFENIFKKKEKPVDMPKATYKKGDKLVDILVTAKVVASKSEARRIIQQNGVKDNDKVVSDIDYKIENGKHTVQVGKRRFIELSEE